MGKNRPKIGVKDFKNGRNNSKKLPIIDIYIDIYKTYIIILLLDIFSECFGVLFGHPSGWLRFTKAVFEGSRDPPAQPG